MIRHDVDQGSEAWVALRLGRPTASQFHRIITPKTLALSRQRHQYMAELIVERDTGRPYDTDSLGWMGRGSEMEAEARRWYEFETGREVSQTGFVTLDNGTAGGSPDGLVMLDGLIEIKCRSARRHVEHLLGSAGDFASVTQVQGLMWITGRAWCDVVGYCPGQPGIIERVERNDETIAAITLAVYDFCSDLKRFLTGREATP